VTATMEVKSSSSGDEDGHVDVGAYLVGNYQCKDVLDLDSDSSAECVALKRRKIRRRALGTLLLASATLMHEYTRYRGGFNELRNYVIPEKVFDPNSYCDKSFRAHFRFERAELQYIVDNLELPEFIISDQRDRGTSWEVMCLMCMKYAFPTRFCTLTREFGRSGCAMSRLIRTLRQLLFSRFASALRSPPPLCALQCACFASKCRAICGNPIVVGFIDGTVREICRPSKLQGPLYSGKDRIHSLKYQAINTPDGIIRHLAGPYPGSRHDQFMLSHSRILDWVSGFPRQAGTDCPHVIYADAGYCTVPGLLMVPFHDDAINALHAGYNMAMSSARISVEWAFGGILRHWASLRYVPGQKLLGNSRIGQMYFVAALLTNLLNCVRPNQTSQYFACTPPSLQEYLQWLKKVGVSIIVLLLKLKFMFANVIVIVLRMLKLKLNSANVFFVMH
jgi:hypothetical protein